MMKTGTALELEPLDRLEEKVRALVGVIEKLRGAEARASEENARLRSEVEALQLRLAEAEDANSEVSRLRSERDQVRNRVAGLLEQIEALELD
jgi:regulator of replication initiation timing